MEHREGGHGDVGELELDVFAVAWIRQSFEHCAKLCDEMAGEGLHSWAYSRNLTKVQVSDNKR